MPDQDLFLFGYQVVDASGRQCYTRCAPEPLLISVDDPRLVRRMLEGTWLPYLICHPSTYCCKRGIETVIPYRSDVSVADDYMFLLESLNKEKRLYLMPECLMQYRWIPSGQTQVNQSADYLKVVQALAKVYYAWQQQVELHPLMSAIIRSSDYRRRFLYDFIIRRRPGSLDALDLGLEPIHRHEFNRYAQGIRRLSVLFRVPMVLVYELTEQFGLRGMLYSIRVGLTYFKYRVLRMATA
jgi:hypothetical protein